MVDILKQLGKKWDDAPSEVRGTLIVLGCETEDFGFTIRFLKSKLRWEAYNTLKDWIIKALKEMDNA